MNLVFLCAIMSVQNKCCCLQLLHDSQVAALPLNKGNDWHFRISGLASAAKSSTAYACSERELSFLSCQDPVASQILNPEMGSLASAILEYTFCGLPERRPHYHLHGICALYGQMTLPVWSAGS